MVFLCGSLRSHRASAVKAKQRRVAENKQRTAEIKLEDQFAFRRSFTNNNDDNNKQAARTKISVSGQYDFGGVGVLTRVVCVATVAGATSCADTGTNGSVMYEACALLRRIETTGDGVCSGVEALSSAGSAGLPGSSVFEEAKLMTESG